MENTGEKEAYEFFQGNDDSLAVDAEDEPYGEWTWDADAQEWQWTYFDDAADGDD